MRLRALGLMLTLALGILLEPLAAYAQHPERIRRVGVLMPSPENTEATVRAVAQALNRSARHWYTDTDAQA